jgi:PEP-CTERM motif
MRKLLLVAATLAVVLCSAPVGATVVNGSFSGTVTVAIGDFNGLFGTSGSAAGTVITGTFSYDTDNFYTPSPVCTVNCALWDSTSGSMANGALTITETINGITLTWDGVYYNGALVAYSSTGGSWPYGYLHQAFEVLSEDATPYGDGANTAALTIGTLDNTASIENPGLDPAGPFNLQALQFGLGGSYWNTPTSLVSWNFNIDTIDTPEPATLGLFAVSLAALGVARRRRA